MDKKILTTFLLLSVMQIAFAGEIVSRTTYSNGTTALMCQSGNGIDYCTEQDKQNAIKALQNPNISVIEEFKFKQTANKNSFNQKCYNAQQKVGAGANLVNTVADTARMVTGFIGVSW